jgi:hypothetical protein
MIYMEMMGRGAMRGMGMGGPAMLGMAAGDLVSALIAMVFLLWITRAGFWQVLFPIRMPAGIAFARWIAIPAVLIGGLRLLCSFWIMLMAWANSLGQGGADFSVLLGTSRFLEQLWTLGFWLTILALLFGVLNELATRYARPLQ